MFDLIYTLFVSYILVLITPGLGFAGFFANLFQVASYFQQSKSRSLEYRLGFAEYTVIPKNYYKILIQITNKGNHAISPDDMYYPFRIRFNKNARILDAQIKTADPYILCDSALQCIQNTVHTEKLLLNTDNFFTLEIWVEGSDARLSIDSHIANVHKWDIIPFTGRPSLSGIIGCMQLILWWLVAVPSVLIGIDLMLLQGAVIADNFELIFRLLVEVGGGGLYLFSQFLFAIIPGFEDPFYRFARLLNSTFSSFTWRHAIGLALVLIPSIFYRLGLRLLAKPTENPIYENIELTEKFRLNNG